MEKEKDDCIIKLERIKSGFGIEAFKRAAVGFWHWLSMIKERRSE